jgi:hypothetical protein
MDYIRRFFSLFYGVPALGLYSSNHLVFKHMTLRAILIGFLGAAFICGASYFNDQILNQTFLVGNNMPVAVYGLLLFLVMIINPLLGKRAFRGKELALIMALTLAACCIPGSGLMRTFTTSLMLPHHVNRTEPGWRAKNILAECPPQMLADISIDEDTALTGFIQGLGQTGQPFYLSQIPWSAWTRTLSFWLPLILTVWLALIAISPMLHKQWADHEHLPYPVANFTIALLPREGGRLPTIMRQRMFWIAAGIVFAIHFNNFLCRWYPDQLIPFKTNINLVPLAKLVTTFQRGGGASMLSPNIYFTVVGLSYFLATDVVLSCGVGPLLWAFVCGVFITYGISLTSNIEGVGYLGLTPRAMLNFGAYFGMFVMILYLGRRYYGSALKRALFIPSGDAVEPHVIIGLRIFLLLVPVLFLQMILAGLAWPLAIIYIGVLFMFFVMISRVMAETGMFYIQPFFMPCGVVWALFGSGALGTRQLMILLMLSLTLVIDPRETLLPFISGSLKVSDDQKLKLGKTLVYCSLAMLLGLAIALPTTLYLQYRHGVQWADSWATKSVPRMPFDNVAAAHEKLSLQDLLACSATYSSLERISHARPEPVAMIAMFSGLALVLLFSMARLRFSWWPLHPVLFLTWATEPQRRMAGSFIIGWLIKVLVSKYGGAKSYQALKPLMFGLVAGEILGAVVPAIIGAIYYAVTGEIPPRFMVLPS